MHQTYLLQYRNWVSNVQQGSVQVLRHDDNDDTFRGVVWDLNDDIIYLFMTVQFTMLKIQRLLDKTPAAMNWHRAAHWYKEPRCTMGLLATYSSIASLFSSL